MTQKSSLNRFHMNSTGQTSCMCRCKEAGRSGRGTSCRRYFSVQRSYLHREFLLFPRKDDRKKAKTPTKAKKKKKKKMKTKIAKLAENNLKIVFASCCRYKSCVCGAPCIASCKRIEHFKRNHPTTFFCSDRRRKTLL